MYVLKAIVYLWVMLLPLGISSQAWIEESYGVDSLGVVQYGSAVDFKGDSKALFMQVFAPSCSDGSSTAAKPLMVWFHGGGFIRGSYQDEAILSLCRSFAKRGYVSASAGYRLGYVSDDTARVCNLPEYACLFATDPAEWHRAYYRAVQDGKGAVQYLVNHRAALGIDTAQVYVAGESAGALVALGVALLDTASERHALTGAVAPAPAPHPNNVGCAHDQGETYLTDSILRPDLGAITGSVVVDSVGYSLRGVGNFYGGLTSNLLAQQATGTVKPAIYSFHQRCDLIVPIDSNRVYAGLSWCLSNGYGCFGLGTSRITIYGSRTISNWNNTNAYGYEIASHFVGPPFPYSYFGGPGSCLDQAFGSDGAGSCHYYDNREQRMDELAAFFAPMISSELPCTGPVRVAQQATSGVAIEVYPNPADAFIRLRQSGASAELRIIDVNGRCVFTGPAKPYGEETTIPVARLSPGLYTLHLRCDTGQEATARVALY